jgi:hypothetical protein
MSPPTHPPTHPTHHPTHHTPHPDPPPRTYQPNPTQPYPRRSHASSCQAISAQSAWPYPRTPPGQIAPAKSARPYPPGQSPHSPPRFARPETARSFRIVRFVLFFVWFGVCCIYFGSLLCWESGWLRVSFVRIRVSWGVLLTRTGSDSLCSHTTFSTFTALRPFSHGSVAFRTFTEFTME